jgi:hypothetical protein
MRYLSAHLSILCAALLFTSNANAQVTTPMPPSDPLPPLFSVGNKLQFTWWHGNEVTKGTMQIDDVKGGWVRMHFIGATTQGWIYPATMTAIWDYR